MFVPSGFDELAGGCGRADGAEDGAFAGFASLWSSAFKAMALKNQVSCLSTT